MLGERTGRIPVPSVEPPFPSALRKASSAVLEVTKAPAGGGATVCSTATAHQRRNHQRDRTPTAASNGVVVQMVVS